MPIEKDVGSYSGSKKEETSRQGEWTPYILFGTKELYTIWVFLAVKNVYTWITLAVINISEEK